MALDNVNVTQNIGQQGTLPAGSFFFVFNNNSTISPLFTVDIDTLQKGRILISNDTNADLEVVASGVKSQTITVLIGETRNINLNEFTLENMFSLFLENSTGEEGTFSYFFSLNQQLDVGLPVPPPPPEETV